MLAGRRCRIFVFDPYVSAPVWRRPPSPPNWALSHDSTATWLSAALVSHPWRTDSLEAADVVWIDVDWSLLCLPGHKPTTGHKAVHVWIKLKTNALFERTSLPKVVLRQQQACATPWHASTIPSQVVSLQEWYIPAMDAGSQFGISPFTISTPAWLTGTVPTPPSLRVPWTKRKLLLFSGHIPKLSIRRHRYELWRLLRSHHDVTTHSHSINCTIGQFSGCQRGSKWIRAQPNSYFIEGCVPFCPGVNHLGQTKRSCADIPNTSSTPSCIEPCVGKRRLSLEANRAAFHRKCAAYRNVDFRAEAADYVRDSGQTWSFEKYLREAMSHRFCLVTMGDRAGTPKITEMVAVGGAGGCIPVILLPRGSPKLGTPQMLPYSRWLDWCSIAYFAPESLARRATGMELLLQRLRAVGQDEARGKLRALVATREAFTMRQGRSASEPSAAEYLLGEMCDLGRRHRAAARAAGNQVGNGSASAAGGAGGDLTTCLLL